MMTRAQKLVKRSPAHPTMDDVARLAGVSRALVSLVMRESSNVSEERRLRVLEAAADLGYRPNAAARTLASRHSRTVGVLLNDLHNPFFAEIMDGIDEVATRAGYRVMPSSGSRRSRREEEILGAFLEYRVDGMILVSPRLAAGHVARVSTLGPVVVVGRQVRARSADLVMTDEAHGAWLAVAHLAGLGHSDIVHIDGGAGAGARERRSGYERAMQELGLQPRVVPGDFTEVAGAAGVEHLLSVGIMPTAIFAANDMVAAGAMDRLEDAGFRIPEDVSIVGFDNTFLAALHHISLTTVDQPREEMGRMAMRILLARIESGPGARTIYVSTPSLVVRATTGPVVTRLRTASPSCETPA